jgi:hypothetical protein
LNRVESPLQAATPMVINDNAAARGNDRERNNSITQDMDTTLMHNTRVELTPPG